MQQDMLGTDALATVAGPFKDFFDKLGGKEGADWLSAFKRFLRKENPWDVAFVHRTFGRDMRKEGWTLESDVPVQDDEVISAMPELVSFLKQGENYINGNMLMIRATDLGCPWGQRHAETLLKNQHLIPEEARKYYLVFTGTVWLDRHGGRDVPCLYWLGGTWCLGFGWFERDFYSGGRLLRSRK